MKIIDSIIKFIDKKLDKMTLKYDWETYKRKREGSVFSEDEED